MKKSTVLMAALLLSQVAFAQSGGAIAPPRFEELKEPTEKMKFTRFYDETPVAPPAPKPKLGPIDTWRYQSCQQDAAEAPTPQGVIHKMRICREKFDQ